MHYDYDKNLIKNSLSVEQMCAFLDELGSDPQPQGSIILNRTVCHCGNSHKLYYYNNTRLFRCYTDCGGDAFDIFELTRKVKSREVPKIRYDKDGHSFEDDWNLPEAIEYVAVYFGFSPMAKEDDEIAIDTKEDWEILNNYNRINSVNIETQKVELQEYDNSILSNLPRPVITPWIEEDITQEVMTHAAICYDPKASGIVIPHFDIDNRLIGIRERTLIASEEYKGKYRPAFINRQLYNHPLSFNLYNLNNSKDNIRKMRKAIVFESEKSCLKYASLFGIDNDISVAVCGSSLIQYQVKLLLECGAEEIVVAFDREGADDDKTKYVKKFYDMQKKYGNVVKLTFMYDKKGELLGFKDSPIDKGKDIFLKLFKSRISL